MTALVDTDRELHRNDGPAEPPRSVRIGLTIVVIVPIITAAARAVRNDWFPIGDSALLFVRARDVLTEHHPFLGSWTSASLAFDDNVNNPGALYDWLLAPFAYVLPPGPATAIGVSAINAAAVVGIVVVSGRIGGWALQRLALVVTAAMTWSIGSQMLLSLVQADALLLPFLLLLVLAAGVGVGHDELLPWFVVVASLILQTYLGYAYIFVFVVVGVVGVRVWQGELWRQASVRNELAGLRRPALTAAVVGVVLWAPTVWEQFFGPGDGNLGRLVRNAGAGDVPIGLGDSIRLVSHAVLLEPWWRRNGYAPAVEGTGFDEGPNGLALDIPNAPPLGVALVTVAIALAVLVLLTVRAQRLRMSSEAGLGAFATVVFVGSVLALSRQPVGVTGLAIHHVQWVWPLIAFVVLAGVWIAVAVLARSSGRSTQRSIDVISALAIGLVVVISVAAIPYHAQPTGPLLGERFQTALAGVRDSIGQLADADPVVYDTSGELPFEPYSGAMYMLMQEDGVEFRIDGDEILIRQLGEGRRADGTEPTRVFQLQGQPAREYSGPACTVAISSGLDPAQDVAAGRLVDEASAALSEDSGIAADEAYRSIVRRDVEPFDPSDQALIDAWVETSFGVFADGEACGGTLADREN